jgi:indole-3-glycerol phosphate synthase
VSVLDAILAETRKECARLRAEPPIDVGYAPLDVPTALRRAADAPLRLVAEIKKRSPSAGVLSRALSVEDRAAAYGAAGAAMISVLVDRAHFDGGYEDLSAARRRTDAPLLAKGFAIDSVQIEAARRSGADAVLLIVRILDDGLLAELHAATLALGMTPVVEVVDEQELDRAMRLDPRVLGVNARDLATLVMDPSRAARVVEAIPRSVVAAWFSGLGTASDVAHVARREGRRLDAALIGEALMRQDDPSPLLAEMVAAARG